MKHFKEFQDIINTLINESENYIIFNDGKAIKTNISEDIVINLNEINECKYRSEKDEEILEKASFCTNINILNDLSLKLIHLNDEESNLVYFFNLKRGVNANISNLYIDYKCNTNTLIEYNVEEGAVLNVCDFASLNANVCESNNYYLEENSKLVLNNLRVNDNLVNALYNIYLLNKKAECVVNNSIINASGFKQSYNFVIHHNARLTKSELVGYGVSKNNSILNIDTNGIIEKGATRAEMFQKSKGIILDIDSTVSASPLLEIDEFDCKATHGASIGAIDESDIFYLMSRGLPREESQNLIINGFFNPYLSKLNDDNVLKYISNIIKNHIEKN